MKVVFCKWLKNIQLEPPGTMSKKQPIDVESPFAQAVNSCQRKTDFESENWKEQTLRNLFKRRYLIGSRSGVNQLTLK